MSNLVISDCIGFPEGRGGTGEGGFSYQSHWHVGLGWWSPPKDQKPRNRSLGEALGG